MTDKTSFAKTDPRYWLTRVYKPMFKKGGKTGSVPTYAVQIQFQKKRRTFSLETSNKSEAARKALDLYLEIQSGTYKDPPPARTPHPSVPEKHGCEQGALTVGSYIKAVEAVDTTRTGTFSEYARSFRQIVAAITGLDEDKRKFDHQSGKHKEWLAEVEAVSLEKITPEAVNQWKLDFLKRAGPDPVKRRSAVASVNSILRRGKALFSRKRQCQLPENMRYPDPFADVDLLPRQSHRYHSKVVIKEIFRAAREELQGDHPEMFKIFLLSTGGGLRRNEIDKLLWEQVDLEQGIIHIRTTAYFEPKSELSGGDVALDKEIVDLFKGYHAQSTDKFVVESPRSPNTNARYRSYRCDPHFQQLISWLREKGVTDNKPLHALRKEFGGLICREFGIYAASRALRHANIELTAQHYVDDSQKVRVGLGKILMEPLREANPDETGDEHL